jgi:pRiA4b ORF-3-like protein
LKEVYQLKVTLKKITPSIWRRLLVRESNTLDDLHVIIQCAMGGLTIISIHLSVKGNIINPVPYWGIATHKMLTILRILNYKI